MMKLYTRFLITSLFFCTAALGVQAAVASQGIVADNNVPTEYFIDGTDLSIYPNPVKSFATISFSKNIDHVVVLNIVGKEIASYEVEQGKTVISVNMSDFQPGVYFVAGMSNGTKLITKRFIKEL